MASRIEDYAVIGDCFTAALVGRDGSIDWLCLPRFDSGACFAALLGNTDNGRWRIAPQQPVKEVRRRYREGSLVLETEFETAEGAVRLIDCMAARDGSPCVVRVVEGLRGRVTVGMELVIRFDYGSIVPWVQRTPEGLSAVGGPDSLQLRTPVELHNKDFRTVAEFSVRAGERVPFTLNWHPSYQPAPDAADPETALTEADAWWRDWSARCRYRGPYREAVLRSLITLKALTYQPTGGIVAAVTTSLPEQIGGVRNWDYRYCWVRDATLTLLALVNAGYIDEARAWRSWLLRAVAGRPDSLNIMYGLAGERRLTESEIGWLSGYEDSRPVRVGNAAHGQFQLDVYGEILNALYQARVCGLEPEPAALDVGRVLVEFVISAFDRPDEGIWEVRGPRRHFTHSKVMAWVALDRAVRAVEEFGLNWPAEVWRRRREEMHAEICEKGFDPGLGSFVQYYGATDLDASLLMIPLVGFLPASDPRVRGTVEAIERGLLHDGFVQRYSPKSAVDGLPPGEGAFLACSFWLADNYVLLGRHDDAVRLFERLLALRNDVGLLSEEYDPVARRLVGNFPQAFSHIGLINTARNLAREDGSAARSRV
jgi:GH15 family glucan-1,4-alpha-glucosidase